MCVGMTVVRSACRAACCGLLQCLPICLRPSCSRPRPSDLRRAAAAPQGDIWQSVQWLDELGMRAIEAGDTRTGITIMQMDEGLDTGAMLLRHECPIEAGDTGGSLRDRLQALGAEALLAALPGILDGSSVGTAQDNASATYASKLRKEEAAIDWGQPAQVLARRIRAFNPANICHGNIGGEALRIRAAHTAEAVRSGLPGEILHAGAKGILVACGEGALLLTALQPAGGRPMTAAELLNGRARLFTPGSRFG
jgi:methionyl-tRNA formyltransferase